MGILLALTIGVGGVPDGSLVCFGGPAVLSTASGTLAGLQGREVFAKVFVMPSDEVPEPGQQASAFGMGVECGISVVASDGEVLFQPPLYLIIATELPEKLRLEGSSFLPPLPFGPPPVNGGVFIDCPPDTPIDRSSIAGICEFLNDLPEECTQKVNLLQTTPFGDITGEVTGVIDDFRVSEDCEVTVPPEPPEEDEVPKSTCPQEPVIDDCTSLAACRYPCDQVYLHSGKEKLEREDLVIPGRGDIHLRIARTYRSELDYDGPLGFGWDFSYGECLFPAGENARAEGAGGQLSGDVLCLNGDGHLDVWKRREDGTFEPPTGYFGTLREEADGSFVLRYPGGFKRIYDSGGLLTAHVDRHDNTMEFEHDDRGNLARVIDAFGRVVEFTFETFPGEVDRLVAIRDFLGREVHYTYDENGDLVEVRTPLVTGTSTANDFPEGRTERYAYASGFEHAELNHNLLSVTYPEEVASGGPPAITLTYGTDPADPSTFDRVTRLTIGGVNASGVGAGGDYTYSYEGLNAGVPPGNFDVPRGKATVTERNGNVIEVFTNERNHHILTRRLTHGDRPGDPEAYETRSSFDEDGQLTRRVFREGNEIQLRYETAGPRAAGKNVLEVRRIADDARGGGEDIVRTFSYEPLYNQVASVTGPRENAQDFEPPLGERSSGQYTTRFFYDYQEGTGPIDEAETYGINLSLKRGLGDLNGDGRIDQTDGNPVRTLAPSVLLLAGSKEAERLGTTSQEIVTETRWNDRGQVLGVIDPEGNVTALEYYPADDPDGDGEKLEDARSTDASGYVKRVIEDAMDSPRRMSVPPVALTTTFGYDAAGNVVSVRNPRGVTTAIEVNALNEPVVVTRGADVSAAAASGQLPTGEAAFGYQVRRVYDHNGRVVRTETEDRQDVSATEGVGEFVERTFTYDILDNLVRRAVEVDADTTLVWEYRYDEEELPVLTIEPEGNRHQVTYDERNLPFRITRGLGSAGESTTQIDYDLNANRARVIDAEDTDGDGEPEATAFTYDGFDRLRRITDALGNEVRMTYDIASNVVRREVFGHPPGDPAAANVRLSDARYLHDELSRVFQVDRALFLSEGFEPVRAVELEDGNSDGFVTERLEYDRHSRVTCSVEDDLEVTRLVYDGADRVIEVIDAAGNRTLTEYDQNSNATVVSSVEVSPEGLVPEERFTTRYLYDQLDRLVRTTDNIGQTTRLEYDSRDNLRRRSDAQGAVAADPLGIFPGEINDEGNTRSYFYDGLGRRLREVSDLRVDGQGGNPLDTTNPTNPDGQVTLTYEYDGNSRLTAIVDDNGNRTSYAYDELNRQVLHRNADGETYSYTYDRDDNVMRIVDPNGSTIRQSFDALNRLTRRDVERGEGVVGTTLETYQYDGLSRIVRATDDNGAEETTHVVETVYDSLSRVWEERQTVPRIGLAPPPQGAGFVRGDVNADGAYDVSDAVWGLLLMEGAEVPCLDAADSNDDGQVDTSDTVFSLRGIFLGEAEPPPPFPDCGEDATVDELRCSSYPPCEVEGQGGGAAPAPHVGVVSAVWSGDGKRLSCTYPGGRRIEQTFDAIDRVKRTSDSAGLIAESSWIGPGYREIERFYGNGTTLSFLDDAGTRDIGYDGLKRIARMRCFLPDGVTFLDREYGYNRASVRTFEKRLDDFSLTDEYSYDSLYRIVETALDQSGLAGAVSRDTQRHSYVLDGVGNRRRVETTSGAGTRSEEFSLNEVNEYTAIGDSPRTHDDNGNLREDEKHEYAFDYENRLRTALSKETGEPIAEYFYHPDSRRARKVLFSAATGEPERETLFFYDGWRVCEEVSGAAGATEVTYVWSPVSIDALLHFERTEEHPLGAGTFYAHQNARADVVALTDGDGTVVEEFLYDDFGNPSQLSAVGNPYLFQGRRLDEETGLYYFRNRYYDPRSGRFVQRDPVWDEGNSGNQYTFVGNGPAGWVDPFGSQGSRLWMPEPGGDLVEVDWQWVAELKRQARRRAAARQALEALENARRAAIRWLTGGVPARTYYLIGPQQPPRGRPVTYYLIGPPPVSSPPALDPRQVDKFLKELNDRLRTEALIRSLWHWLTRAEIDLTGGDGPVGYPDPVPGWTANELLDYIRTTVTRAGKSAVIETKWGPIDLNAPQCPEEYRLGMGWPGPFFLFGRGWFFWPSREVPAAPDLDPIEEQEEDCAVLDR